MNNLKRVLSLGLTGAMLSGMMLVGASAASVTDFTDSSEIKNQEAVTTMSALGVILGKDTGAFDPAGNVTRAEMAKMITVMLNGGKDPVLGTKATPTYSDIDNHWAESYIEYCTTEGVISGQGDGTFNPDGSVTGSQAAKMALVALGYDSAAYNFTGIDWEVNTNRIANSEADLYDGLAGINPSEAISRDNAAQMLYNVLDAKTKVMRPTTSTNGTIEYTYYDGDSFMETKFGAVKVVGVVIANEIADLTSNAAIGGHRDANRTQIRVTNYGTGNGEQDSFGNAAGTGTVTVQATTGLDELGRSVSVFVKSNSSTTKAEIMGDVIVSDDNTVVTDYSADSIATVADDNGMDIVAGTQIADNYRNASTLTSGVASAASTRGVEKILIDNDDDGEVEYVLRNTYAFGKVTSYVTSGDGAITVSAGTSLTASDKDDVVGFDDVARNDYVLAAYIGGRLYVEKAETVTGELESYRTDSSNNTTKLEVGGTNYNVSHVTGYTGGADNIIAAMAYGPNNLDTEATFYMGKGDYVAAVGEVVENAYNYALVLAGDNNGVSDQVRVVLSDGTKATYTVNTNGQTYDPSNVLGSTNDNIFGKGSVCSYTIGSNGTIRLTEVAPEANFSGATATAFSKGRTGITDSGNTVYANSSTAFFYVGAANLTGTLTNKMVNTYTGYTSAPSVTGATSYVYTNNAGRAVAVVFVGTGITTADVDDFVYIYGTGNSNNERTSADAFVAGSDQAESIYVDGKVYAYATSSTLSGSVTASEGLYKYSINSNNYYELSAIDDYTGVAGTGNKIVSDYNATTNAGGTTYGVYSASGRTVVIGEWNASTQAFDQNLFEVKITSDTMLVDDSSDLDDPALEIGGTPEEGDRIAYALFSLDGNIADEAMMIVTKRNQAVAAQPAPTIANATLAAGTTNPLTTISGTTSLVAGTPATATAATYNSGSAETVKVTIGAVTGGTAGQATVAIDNGAATNYTSGADITLPGTGAHTVTITVPVTGDSTHSNATFTYTVTITVS